MAVARAGNVISISADNDTVTDSINICSIRYKAGTGSPSIVIKADASASGTTLWETSSSSDLESNVEIRAASGIHVDLAGTGTILYLYLEND